MDDEQRSARIDQLLLRLAEVQAQKAALVSEAEDFAARIGEIRKSLGNPYFYSGGHRDRPEHADESIAKFSGFKSHEPGLQLVRRLKAANRELSTLREQLRGSGLRVE